MIKKNKARPAGLRDQAGSGEKNHSLSIEHKDVLAEVGNISMGAAATALSHLLDKKVKITTPEVSLVSMNDIRINYPAPCLIITVNYLAGLQGKNVFLIREEDALTIASLVMGVEPGQGPKKIGEMELSALGEAMNQMMGSAATAMSEFLNCYINISPPGVKYRGMQTDSMELTGVQGEGVLIQVAFHLEIEEYLNSKLLQLSPLGFGKLTASCLLSKLSGESPGGETAATVTKATAATIAKSNPLREQATEPLATGAAEELSVKKKTGVIPTLTSGQAFSVKPEKTFGLQPKEYERINLIRDIPVEISAVLGRASLPLNKVFSLVPGETLSLDSCLGELVELLADERPVAMGEVVSVNGKFGVRIVKVIDS